MGTHGRPKTPDGLQLLSRVCEKKFDTKYSHNHAEVRFNAARTVPRGRWRPLANTDAIIFIGFGSRTRILNRLPDREVLDLVLDTAMGS